MEFTIIIETVAIWFMYLTLIIVFGLIGFATARSDQMTMRTKVPLVAMTVLCVVMIVWSAQQSTVHAWKQGLPHEDPHTHEHVGCQGEEERH